MKREWPVSRRAFLQGAGALTGGALLLRYAPAVLAQANPLDARRAQLGAAPIETTKLADRLVMLSGPGGNVVVSHGDFKVVVDGFVHGHGPLARRPSLEAFGRMLTGVRDGVQKLKAAGKTLAEVQAAKPSAAFDAAWAKGMMSPDDFVALVYDTLR
jgi:hypothetical protein